MNIESIIQNSMQFIEIENRIVYTVNQVNKRGFDENHEAFDDYSELMERAEFKNVIITGIYENYFPPKRHEFELQLITDLIEAIISSKLAIFIAGAAASDLIGDVFTTIVKRLLRKIIDGFKGHNKEKEKFEAILIDVKKVEEYFVKIDSQEVNILQRDLRIDIEKLILILKLLGFKSFKMKGKKYWTNKGACE